MENYIVSVPVADLRKEPISHKNSYEKDPLQESQLVFCEKVIGHHKKNGWVFVEAIEQKKWVQGEGWKGYPGWVKQEHLQLVREFPDYNSIIDIPWLPVYNSPEPFAELKLTIPFGTSLKVVNELSDCLVIELSEGSYGFIPRSGVRAKECCPSRDDICQKGLLFLNYPYLWGGRSPFLQDSPLGITSVDCSGLTNLLYRINGLDIPRDAHDQLLKCHQKSYDELEPGDLIFTASKQRPERMTHVMLHLSPEVLLESSLAPKCVRKVTTTEKFQTRLNSMSSGTELGQEVIYFGSIL